ncbi:unnamed protein product [Allacma fusca]|uniref:DUF4806 domain-containing protein n=1 Tax=Allacma fusca TaxID=39272 RepID=A0A8J2JDN3_9HEXA|nr:unnamed protein product [Allacma fusca]
MDLSLPFAVVHFVESEEIEAVPVKWIFENDMRQTCYWPNFRKSDRILQAVKSMQNPIESVWTTHVINVKNTFSTYDEAISNIKHFEAFSDLEAEFTPTPISKSRAGRPIKKPRTNFDEDCVTSLGSNSVEARATLLLPEFPKLVSTELVQVAREPPVIASCSSNSSDTEMFQGDPSTSVIFTDRCSHNCEEFWNKFSAFQTVCVRNFATIQANQTSLLRMMDTLVHANNALVHVQGPPISQSRPVFGFPFDSRETLVEFDTKLGSDEAFRNSCVKYLASIGGNDLTTAVYEILKKILTYKLAYTFSFTGINGKGCFSSLELNDLIFEVIKLNPRMVNETMITVRKKIQSWVQHAGDHLPKSEKLGTRRTSSTEQAEGYCNGYLMSIL